MNTLSIRLLLSRRDLGLDQIELAERSGISRGYISKLETNKAGSVSVSVVFSLAEALGVAPQYLLGLTDNPLGPDAEEEEEDDSEQEALKQQLNQTTAEFIDIYTSLPADAQKQLLSLARMLRNADTPRIIGSE